MISRVQGKLLEQILDSGYKGVILRLAVAVDGLTAMLKSGLIAVIGYFFDGLGDIEIEVAAGLKELEQFALLKRDDN